MLNKFRLNKIEIYTTSKFQYLYLNGSLEERFDEIKPEHLNKYMPLSSIKVYIVNNIDLEAECLPKKSERIPSHWILDAK